MPNYQKGLVYKICCLDPNITSCYVGSTTDTQHRQRTHKSHCNNPNDEITNYKVYQVIRDNGGWDNWRVMTIEEYPCKSKYELEVRERYWAEVLKADLNNNIPTRKKNEYREANLCYLKQKQKEYYDANVDTIKHQHKKYYDDNADTIKQKQKEYYNKQKATIRIKQKEHYEANKHRLHEKIECPICFLMLNRASLTRHTKRVHSV
jgi:hypothetical protein